MDNGSGDQFSQSETMAIFKLDLRFYLSYKSAKFCDCILHRSTTVVLTDTSIHRQHLPQYLKLPLW